MTPFDHARRLIKIENPGKQVLLVSLASQSVNLPLCLTPSAQHADYIALMARQIIALEVAEALRNEDCRIAAEIDQAFFNREIWQVPHAAALARTLAELHVIDCIRKVGETNRQQPGRDSESAAPSGCNGGRSAQSGQELP